MYGKEYDDMVFANKKKQDKAKNAKKVIKRRQKKNEIIEAKSDANNTLKCSVCKNLFTSVFSFKNHLKRKPDCKARYQNDDTVKDNRKKDEVKRCKICNCSYDSTLSFMGHF